MKMNSDHMITLYIQTLNIFEIMKPISGPSEHIFPRIKFSNKKQMNNQMVNAII